MARQLLKITFLTFCLVLFSICLSKENTSQKYFYKEENFFKGGFECDEQDGYVICVEKIKISKNTGVPLKVGDIYRYNIKRKDGHGRDIYVVKKLERINNISYYMVQREHYFVNSNEIISIYKVWFEKESGEVLKLEFDNITIKGEVAELLISDTWFFAPWMLALNDSFKLIVKFNSTYTKRGYKIYEIVGKEKINGIECYKVKIMTVVDSKVDSVVYFWIDVKRRILIKSSLGETIIFRENA